MNTSFAATVSAALSLSLASLNSPAQTPAEAPTNAEPAALETITVTGSLLPSTPDQVAVPVITLDSKQLEQAGVSTNALEILRKVVPSFAGRSNAGTSNANNDNQRTAGGSQLQLRNLPTLILVNGRRVANSGVGGINGKNFVDVNQIPAAAIDHIEVLTDGASSIYGSDAIGGVVNFILKSDYDGLKAGGRFGGATGDYKERSVYLTGGTSIGGFNFTGTASYSKTNPLFQYTREFTSPLYNKTSSIPGVIAAGGVNPGAILAPGVNSPSQLNPTGMSAAATSVNQLIANGTYVPTTPGAVAAGFDVSPYQTCCWDRNCSHSSAR
jgi:iron complex outermembrane receptor protein